MNTDKNEVFRLVYEDDGQPQSTWRRQFLYRDLASARGVCTKHNNSWRERKLVIQRGTVDWDSEPV